jgi:hypothetical protein
MGRFIQRVIGASALDASAYEDVERDTTSLIQAFVVVLLSAVATGIGARGMAGANGASVALVATMALITWLLWAVITLEIGGHLLPSPTTRVDAGQLLRTIGFAAAPGMLSAAGIIPAFARPMFAVSVVWMVAAMVVAVRQALDYESTGRALLVCAIGAALVLAMVFVVSLFVAPAVS